MTYTVQYTRFFEEFGCEDIDSKEFESISEANEFFNQHSDDENIKMFAGNERIR